MQRIYKYPLQITDVQTLELPRNAEILCVQTQNNEPQLWALVNPDAPLESLVIETFGTGHDILEEPLPDVPRRYLGTFQISDGALVFHVFIKLGLGL